jgi:hypothetical protein
MATGSATNGYRFGYKWLQVWLHMATIVATKLFKRIIMLKTPSTPKTFRFSDSELEKLETLASEECASLNEIALRFVKFMIKNQLTKGRSNESLPKNLLIWDAENS